MKRVKIAAALISLVLIYSISSLFILKSQNSKLRSVVKNISIAYSAGNMENAAALADELASVWHDYEKTVTMIVHDDTLNELNIAVARVYPLLADGNTELEAELQSIYNQIEHIYEEECPVWYNIL